MVEEPDQAQCGLWKGLPAFCCSQAGADGHGSCDNVLSTYNVAVAAPGFMLAMSVEPHPRQGQDDYPNFTMEKPAPQDQQMAEPGFKPELRLQSLSGAVYSLTDAQGPGDGLGPSPSSTISMLCDLGPIPYLSKPQLFIHEMGIGEAPTYQWVKRKTIGVLRAWVPAQKTCSINGSGFTVVITACNSVGICREVIAIVEPR